MNGEKNSKESSLVELMEEIISIPYPGLYSHVLNYSLGLGFRDCFWLQTPIKGDIYFSVSECLFVVKIFLFLFLPRNVVKFLMTSVKK